VVGCLQNARNAGDTVESTVECCWGSELIPVLVAVFQISRYGYSHPQDPESDEYLQRGIYSSVTDAQGNSQEYDYDILDRVKSVKDNAKG